MEDFKASLPSYQVPRLPLEWQAGAVTEWNWRELPALSPLALTDGSGLAQQQTQVRVCYSGDALYVRFDCEDDDIWGTYKNRDDPLYEEEVVEVFIAPGEEAPTRYFEVEVSPYGVVFDCIITNPSPQPTPEQPYDVNETWNAERLESFTVVHPEQQSWWAILKIPWSDMGGYQEVWRANFYRIERSRQRGTEFSCWSPTLSKSFHKPERFGTLRLERIKT
jgi:Carbohydrate-binding family 9